MQKICILGNADCLGIRLFSFFDKLGYNVDLYTADEIGRGKLEEYQSNIYNKGNNIYKADFDRKRIIKFLLFPSKQLNKINSIYSVVFIIGISPLLASIKIKAPKILIPMGGEVNEVSNKNIRPRIFSSSGLKILLIRYFAIYSLKKIDLILDGWEEDHRVYKNLNIMGKVFPFFLGQDTSFIKKNINNSLRKALDIESQKYKITLLWFSRLNIDKRLPGHYKGAEIFLRALKKFQKNIENKEIQVVMGKHGNDVEKCLYLSRQYNLHHLIKWVDHLTYKDLCAYLSIQNAVLVASMTSSQTTTIFSGIIRDGYSIGTPMIHNVTKENSERIYGKPGPGIIVTDISELEVAISRCINMTKEEHASMKRESELYGIEVLDYQKYILRLLKVIRERLNVDIQPSHKR